MTPRPEYKTIWIFLLSVLVLLAGVWASRPVLVAAGGSILLFLAWNLTESLAYARSVRNAKLEFYWEVKHPEQVPTIYAIFRHQGPSEYCLSSLSVAITGAAEALPVEHGLVLTPHVSIPLEIRLKQTGSGRVMLHGMIATLKTPWSLFSVDLYFASPIGFSFPFVSNEQAMQRRVTANGLGMGRQLMKHKGSEWVELREYRSGDDFKTIAWKASARKGKWIVRESQQEAEGTVIFVLDAGASMKRVWENKQGKAFSRWQEGCATVITLASNQLGQGQKVGLIAFDHRVVLHHPPSSDLHQLGRIKSALMDLDQCVLGDMTEETDEDVVAMASRHARLQGHDAMVLNRTHQQHADKARLYCKKHVLPLTPRFHGSDERLHGWVALTDLLLQKYNKACTVMLFSDMHGILDQEQWAGCIKKWRIQGHHVMLCLPKGLSEDNAGRDTVTHQAMMYGESLQFEIFKTWAKKISVPLKRF